MALRLLLLATRLARTCRGSQVRSPVVLRPDLSIGLPFSKGVYETTSSNGPSWTKSGKTVQIFKITRAF